MKLHLKNIGQIRDAAINFTDLTVFIGPQASGKSITLQWFKLLANLGAVQEDLQKQGLSWNDNLDAFFDIYFGEGMASLWDREKSEVIWNGKPFIVEKKFLRQASKKSKTVFLIPAQRVWALRDGWPRAFSDYTVGDPYSVRAFSEHLRHLVGRKGDQHLFPCVNQMKADYREILTNSIFGDFHLEIDKRLQKRLILADKTHKYSLPYMVWSAGQREFVPLLLGLSDLMLAGKTQKRGDIEYVIIEELEMGLHPKAITSVLLLVLELLHRGYKVCLSTHSPQILELVWTIKYLAQNHAAPDKLLDLFDARHSPGLKKVAASALQKKQKVYFFDSGDGIVKDISNLDVSAANDAENSWGGLLSFSDKSNELVAEAVAQNIK